MDHKISLIDPEEFFDNNIFIDLKEKLYQTKEDDMIEGEILDN